MLWALCLCLPAQALYPPVQLSPAGPKKSWSTAVERVGDSAMSVACFDEGMILWQDSRATRIDPKTGKTVWAQTYTYVDPPDSTGPTNALRFGDEIVVYQSRQGRTYASALTALDARTGILRWHKRFETAYFRTEKDANRLFTFIGMDRKEISLEDGSIVDRPAPHPNRTSLPIGPAFPDSPPDGMPMQAIPWKEGWLAFYDYEDFVMDLGDMAGVHGLAYLRLKGGVCKDAWAGKWMSRHKNHVRNPGPNFVVRLLQADRVVWAIVEHNGSRQIVGIDLSGEAGKPILTLSPEISPQMTSKGFLLSSQGWLWFLNSGRLSGVRPLNPNDDNSMLTPFGLLRFDALSGMQAGRQTYRMTLEPILPVSSR